MPEIESSSKPSQRLERQAARKRQPQNVRLGLFLTEADADVLDSEAAENGLSVSSYLRILVSRGRRELLAEAEVRAAGAAEARQRPPKDSFEAAVRKAEERKLKDQQAESASRAIRRGSIRETRC